MSPKSILAGMVAMLLCASGIAAAVNDGWRYAASASANNWKGKDFMNPDRVFVLADEFKFSPSLLAESKSVITCYHEVEHGWVCPRPHRTDIHDELDDLYYWSFFDTREEFNLHYFDTKNPRNWLADPGDLMVTPGVPSPCGDEQQHCSGATFGPSIAYASPVTRSIAIEIDTRIESSAGEFVLWIDCFANDPCITPTPFGDGPSRKIRFTQYTRTKVHRETLNIEPIYQALRTPGYCNMTLADRRDNFVYDTKSISLVYLAFPAQPIINDRVCKTDVTQP